METTKKMPVRSANQRSADEDIARAIKLLELAAMKSALIKGKAARLERAIADAKDAIGIQ